MARKAKGSVANEAKVTVASTPWTAPSVLEIIETDRQSRYGPPEVCLAAIGEAWSAYFAQRGHAYGLSRIDVANLFAMSKLVRAGYSHDEDSIVDSEGYARFAARWKREQVATQQAALTAAMPTTAELATYNLVPTKSKSAVKRIAAMRSRATFMRAMRAAPAHRRARASRLRRDVGQRAALRYLRTGVVES